MSPLPRMPPRTAALLGYLLLLGVALTILLPKIGDFGFWDPWEPKYAESAREMIERESWITPYYREKVRLAKPILVYWGILAGSAFFGLNELGARIGGVAFAIAALLAVAYGVTLLRGRRAGLICGLVLATTPHWYVLARKAMPDIYLATSLGVSLIFLAVALYGPEKRRGLHFGICYLGFALALLAKGPFITGGVFFGTLAVLGFAHLDGRLCWAPERRGRLVRLLVAAALLLPAAIGLAGVSLVFAMRTVDGSGPADAYRTGLEPLIYRWHLAEIALGLLTLAGLALLARLFRNGVPTDELRRGLAAVVAVAVPVALLVAFVAREDTRVVVGALLACLAILGLLIALALRFLDDPGMREVVGPWVRPVVSQLVLFVSVVVVVAGPWHLAILIEQGNDFLNYFIFKHNIGRAAEMINQTGAADFYPRILIYSALPWSCLAPVAIAGLPLFRDRERLRQRGPELLLAIACAVILAAFSLSATKFAHYLSPLTIPVAVLVGLTLDRAIRERVTPASRLAWAASFLLFLLPVMELLRKEGAQFLVGAFTVKHWVPQGYEPGGVYLALLVAFATLLFLSIAARSRALVYALCATAVLIAVQVNAVFLPRLSAIKTMKHLCESWKVEATSEEPICFFGAIKHSIFFYTDFEVSRLREERAFEEFMAREGGAYCIVPQEYLPKLKRRTLNRYPHLKLSIADDSHPTFLLVRSEPASERRR